jgi:phosphoglycolate phosphatase-like HAD superfamily hydrolase
MLVVFDVDGTLTATDDLDAEVYARSFEAVFGTPLPATSWSRYEFPTDRGVACEAVRLLELDASRIPELEERFVADLRSELRRRGARSIPGATGVLDRLTAAGHGAALATGAWERSARMKLAAAGLELHGRALVGSDFDPDRTQVIREAIRRSGEAARAVYVGDGLWDVRAARALGLPFVGVDHAKTGALREAGVRQVIGDYEDFEAFLRALGDAAVP